MPKIKNIHYWIGKEKRTTVINYATRDNEFYLSLPREMFDVADLFIASKEEAMAERSKGYGFYGVDRGKDRLHSGSQAGLESLLKDYIDFYMAVKTQKRRVIVADFEYHSNDIAWSRGGTFQDGGYSEIKFRYWIATEYNNNGKRDFINEEDGKSLHSVNHRPDYYKIIPYTEESEKFMKNFSDAMNQLMKNIGKYCGSEQALLGTISNGMMLLNSPPSKVEESKNRNPKE